MAIYYYAAPMEGVTGFAWRNAHAKVFGSVDKYFAPFAVANQTHQFKTKEIRDLSQGEETLVPQLLADKAEHCLWGMQTLKEMGFCEVNLNVGCPSQTVVTRGRGSGLLKEPEKLKSLLDGIFSADLGIAVSVKTRIGFENEEEWEKLLSLYEDYPLSELIVHGRVKTQQYSGFSNRDIFKKSLKTSPLSLVYNGDVEDVNDEAFSYGCSVMSGRGLVRDPALFRKARGGKSASREELMRFHDLLLEGYESYMKDASSVLHHMKEFWFYFRCSFEAPEEPMKAMLRSKDLQEYRKAAKFLMDSCPVK